MAEAGDDAQPQPQQDEAGVATSLYPSAPRYYTRYTRDNVARLAVVRAAREADEAAAANVKPAGTRRRKASASAVDAFQWAQATPPERQARQAEVLEKAAAEAERDKTDHADDGAAAGPSTKRAPALLPAPDFDLLLEMGPPNVDWIEEDGHYSCFGQQWPVEETLPSLRDMGLPQLYPDLNTANVDRPAVLTTLLRTMLKSYLGLVDDLLTPPHDYLGADGQWRFTSQDRARAINDVAVNITHLLNELRPTQARHDVRDMMQAQLTRRRQETQLVREQCAAMRAEVDRLAKGIVAEPPAADGAVEAM